MVLFGAAQKSIMLYGQDLRLKLTGQKDSASFQPRVNTELADDTVVIVSVAVDKQVAAVAIVQTSTMMK